MKGHIIGYINQLWVIHHEGPRVYLHTIQQGPSLHIQGYVLSWNSRSHGIFGNPKGKWIQTNLWELQIKSKKDKPLLFGVILRIEQMLSEFYSISGGYTVVETSQSQVPWQHFPGLNNYSCYRIPGNPTVICMGHLIRITASVIRAPDNIETSLYWSQESILEIIYEPKGTIK